MASSGDSFVCLKDVTDGAYTVLCKNANRHPNEAMEVVVVPEVKIDDETEIDCTYATVSPARSNCHRCVLCKPVWSWGCLMGSNDEGVSISTEVVYANSKAQYVRPRGNGTPPKRKSSGHLTGPDICRLALMFADCAVDAVHVIDHYLKNHPQDGCTEWMGSNGGCLQYWSYLVADHNDVWIVQTINQGYAAKKLNHGVFAQSNRYTLSSPLNMVSASLMDWCDENGLDWRSDLDLYSQFGAWRQSYFNGSNPRCKFISERLDDILCERKLNILDFTEILRSHQLRSPNRNPYNEYSGYQDIEISLSQSDCGIDEGIFGQDICAHAGYGPVRCSNTTGSMICVMHRDGLVTNFVTGTSCPCISTFKPLYVSSTIPTNWGVTFRKFRNGNFVDLSSKKQHRQSFDRLLSRKRDIMSTTNMLVFDERFADKQLWWKHEVFHRLYLQYFVGDDTLHHYIQRKIRNFESEMFNELVDEHKEYGTLHLDDDDTLSIQEQRVAKYWKESSKIMDDMLLRTKSDISRVKDINLWNLWEIIHYLISIINILNIYAEITRYLNQRQWAYWNSMAGIDVLMFEDKRGRSTASTSRGVSALDMVANPLYAIFQRLRGRIRLILTSVWGAILFAIGWRLLN